MSGSQSPTSPSSGGGGKPSAPTSGSCAPCDCCKKCPCASKKSQTPVVTPVAAPTDLNCGGNQWKVWFNLPEKTCNGGWIIQEINYTIDRKRKNGTTLQNKVYHYWEAWEVEKCKKATVWQDKGLDDNDDSYTDSPSPGSKGTYTTVGKVKFYEGSLPPDFKTNNPLTLAGILHSTTTKPAFWDGTGATHNLTSTWDCTDGASHPSTITTTP